MGTFSHVPGPIQTHAITSPLSWCKEPAMTLKALGTHKLKQPSGMVPFGIATFSDQGVGMKKEPPHWENLIQIVSTTLDTLVVACITNPNAAHKQFIQILQEHFFPSKRSCPPIWRLSTKISNFASQLSHQVKMFSVSTGHKLHSSGPWHLQVASMVTGNPQGLWLHFV